MGTYIYIGSSAFHIELDLRSLCSSTIPSLEYEHPFVTERNASEYQFLRKSTINPIHLPRPLLSKKKKQCVRLLALLGPKVSFPQTPAYNTSLASYFTQQNAHLYPSCIVTPSNTDDVSTILEVLTSPSQDQIPTLNSASANTNTACPFAIRSGGHAYNTAFNNINSGTTIDLSNLNSITLSADQKTVSVGPGATWEDVYDILDPAHISVPGGRAGQVGVGGLTLGGGISYFSPRYGWTCDSVSEFEVVLAGGEVVSASQGYNHDLWISLCGGGPANFGIVTRVNLTTFPQGMIWGGFVYYTLDTIPEQLSAFEGFNTAESYDEHASLIMSFGFSAGVGGAVVNSVVYTKDEKYPAVYEPFFALPSLSSTVRVASLGEIAREQGSFSPDGRRYASLLFQTHFSLLFSVYSIIRSISGALSGYVEGDVNKN
jgi:FAD/FMN-containing dehydrogenase